jgi:UDP-2,4-diacetamido-2,4,6-trideoxy-beta-L-altropyranose hydrolase
MTRHCANEGILYYLGSGNDLTRTIVRAALETFLHSKEARISMARKGRLLVDPMGCQRVISTMLPSSITLRKATINDCGDIYKWRNDPFTRKYLFNSNPISIDIHSSWFESSLNNPKRYLLIGEQLDQAIGLFRIDVESNFAWISVYLVPGLSGHGFGTQLTKAGCIWVKNNLKKVNSLRAKIIPLNKPSLQMFLGCGFVEHHRDLRLLLT